MAEAVAQVLQALLLPEPDLCPEMALHLRLRGDVTVEGGALVCADGAALLGDTYYNLFNIGKWQDRCDLRDLSLRLCGAGRFELAIWRATHEGRTRLSAAIVTLDGTAECRVPLEGLTGPAVLYYEVSSLGAGRIEALEWITQQAPHRLPQLMLSVTTFRREAAVARTAARFARFIAQSPLAGHIALLIVDNGASAEIAPADGVALVRNENLGGAGGFARGLLEARARGATHCLFMDDDAAIHMGSLARTWALLAHAVNPATAVIGAISSGRDPAVLWENGATFSSRCRPCHHGVDLRCFPAVLEMELETTLPPPPNHYGGWWYFAFPVDRAAHMPFPFFVRGDDISFSLVNGFDAVTLPGVICFQDLDFADRESPLTLYLDLRSHLAHHLAIPKMGLGRWRTARIAAWFFARSLCACHYETLAALNLAVEDVLKGPDHFARHADMASRRADIAALRKTEVWRPAPFGGPSGDTWADDRPGCARLDAQSGVMRQVMKYTLNGHLVPFFGRWGNRVTIPADQRGSLQQIWGAARITYVSPKDGQTYRVRHDKRAMLREGLRMSALIMRLVLRHGALSRDWQAGYDRLTTGNFWAERLLGPTVTGPQGDARGAGDA